MTLALLGGPAAGQESQACGFGPAVHAAASSVVHVRSTFSMGEEPFGPDAGEVIFSNTGFFVGTGGEVLTSLVGLVGCRDIAVTASEGRTAPARLVALDQPSGLAVLKAELTGTVPLELVESPPAPGSWALLARTASKKRSVLPKRTSGLSGRAIARCMEAMLARVGPPPWLPTP